MVINLNEILLSNTFQPTPLWERELLKLNPTERDKQVISHDWAQLGPEVQPLPNDFFFISLSPESFS